MHCIECQQQEANKGSGLCDPCERVYLKQINGFLYLPAAGLTINLGLLLLGVLGIIAAMIGVWPYANRINWFDAGYMALTILHFVITVCASWCFFKKKKHTRILMIAYYLAGMISVLYYYGIPVCFYDAKMDSKDISFATTSVIAAVIWIPYFLKSERINEVFCR